MNNTISSLKEAIKKYMTVPSLLSNELLYTPYISRGFYFCEFRESGATHKFNNTRKLIYLRSRRKNATCVYAILVVQYTVHMQMSE